MSWLPIEGEKMRHISRLIRDRLGGCLQTLPWMSSTETGLVLCLSSPNPRQVHLGHVVFCSTCTMGKLILSLVKWWNVRIGIMLVNPKGRPHRCISATSVSKSPSYLQLSNCFKGKIQNSTSPSRAQINKTHCSGHK